MNKKLILSILIALLCLTACSKNTKVNETSKENLIEEKENETVNQDSVEETNESEEQDVIEEAENNSKQKEFIPIIENFIRGEDKEPIKNIYMDDVEINLSTATMEEFENNGFIVAGEGEKYSVVLNFKHLIEVIDDSDYDVLRDTKNLYSRLGRADEFYSFEETFYKDYTFQDGIAVYFLDNHVLVVNITTRALNLEDENSTAMDTVDVTINLYSREYYDENKDNEILVGDIELVN